MSIRVLKDDARLDTESIRVLKEDATLDTESILVFADTRPEEFVSIRAVIALKSVDTLEEREFIRVVRVAQTVLSWLAFATISADRLSNLVSRSVTWL